MTQAPSTPHATISTTTITSNTASELGNDIQNDEIIAKSIKLLN